MSLNRPVEARSLLLELTADKDAGRDCQVWIDLELCRGAQGQAAPAPGEHARGRAVPDRFEGYTLRALYNRLEGRPEESLKGADEAIERCGNDPNPYMLRSLVLQDLGRPFEAKQTIEQALANNPSSQRLQVMLAAIERQTGGNSAVTGVPEQGGQP